MKKTAITLSLSLILAACGSGAEDSPTQAVIHEAPAVAKTYRTVTENIIGYAGERAKCDINYFWLEEAEGQAEPFVFGCRTHGEPLLENTFIPHTHLMTDDQTVVFVSTDNHRPTDFRSLNVQNWRRIESRFWCGARILPTYYKMVRDGAEDHYPEFVQNVSRAAYECLYMEQQYQDWLLSNGRKDETIWRVNDKPEDAWNEARCILKGEKLAAECVAETGGVKEY